MLSMTSEHSESSYTVENLKTIIDTKERQVINLRNRVSNDCSVFCLKKWLGSHLWPFPFSLPLLSKASELWGICAKSWTFLLYLRLFSMKNFSSVIIYLYICFQPTIWFLCMKVLSPKFLLKHPTTFFLCVDCNFSFSVLIAIQRFASDYSSLCSRVELCHRCACNNRNF